MRLTRLFAAGCHPYRWLLAGGWRHCARGRRCVVALGSAGARRRVAVRAIQRALQLDRQYPSAEPVFTSHVRVAGGRLPSRRSNGPRPRMTPHSPRRTRCGNLGPCTDGHSLPSWHPIRAIRRTASRVHGLFAQSELTRNETAMPPHQARASCTAVRGGCATECRVPTRILPATKSAESIEISSVTRPRGPCTGRPTWGLPRRA